MREALTDEAAMRVLWAWITCYGNPASIYGDSRSVYITAYSPQAKGRMEHNHEVFQDRFVRELRLRGIRSIEEANAMLSGGFFEGRKHPPAGQGQGDPL